MIESILPTGTVAVDTTAEPPDATLFPEEEAIIQRALTKRRQEFTTARWCARRAMARLGRPPMPVLCGPRGEPQWPDGLVGSITHCAGYRGAVVAEADVITTVGIDAEPNEALPTEVLPAVSLPEERVRLRTLRDEHPHVHWDRLIFSAKESVYKAWYPLTSRWLDFEDADITIDPLDGTFHTRLTVAGPWVHGRELTEFSGRWMAAHGLILTAVTVVAPAPATDACALAPSGVVPDR